MVRKEIWTCLLAYNLIRQTMLQSALASRQITAAVEFHGGDAEDRRQLGFGSAVIRTTFECADCEANHKHLARHRVGHRPDRVEPRANKRRPKMLALLTIPRAQAKAELLAAHV